LEQLRILAVREGLFRNRPPRVSARHDAYMTNPPPGMYQPQQPVYAQQLLPGWEERTHENGPFLDAFDFSFDKYATPAVVQAIYALTVVSCVLAYGGGAYTAFAIFGSDHDIAGVTTIPGSPLPGIVTVVLGWIPALLIILSVRVRLEHALAGVRTAIDARALRTRYVGGATV
jgi:hypothetical protein